MPFAVTRLFDRYRISHGDGEPIEAANLTEVKEALSHVYDTREAGRKGSHHFGRKQCPYCRLMGLA